MAVLISGVEPRSPAAKAGIQGGILQKINGHEIRDVLDYRFYMLDPHLKVEIQAPDGKIEEYLVRKGEYADLGLEFETYLMDRQRFCKNRCIFCFIDQMPKGMRETLYFKDDDSRLSFLFGNYITLTNLQEEDIQRIIEMHISPMNISVHTTNPELRVKMMANPKAADSLQYLEKLAAAGIKLNTQLVLCPGINDGEELKRTLKDLGKLVPALESISCVPVGLTRFRENLFPLTPYTREQAAEVIQIIEEFSEEHLKNFGVRIARPADEFFLKAELPLPEPSYYGDFQQLENGVGLVSLLQEEFERALEEQEKVSVAREISIATGKASYPLLLSLAEKAEKAFPSLQIHVYPMENHFFGEQITVSGLVTGKDLTAQLKGKRLGQELLFPEVMLRHEGDLFLDDMCVAEAEEILGIPMLPVPNDGYLLLDSMLGNRSEHME